MQPDARATSARAIISLFIIASYAESRRIPPQALMRRQGPVGVCLVRFAFAPTPGTPIAQRPERLARWTTPSCPDNINTVLAWSMDSRSTIPSPMLRRFAAVALVVWIREEESRAQL